MTDKILKAAQRARMNAWTSFKAGINLHGYEYYKPPAEVNYRYPAPGSCPLDEDDHPNLYKNDWKTPFRQSEYNIQKIEMVFDDEDPRQAENYISNIPGFDATSGRAANYDYKVR